MLIRRAGLALTALAFGLAAVALSSPERAHAEPFDFPSGVRAPVGDQVRVWLDLGDYEDRDPASVSISGIDLSQRRDGVWVGSVEPAPEYAHNWMLVTVDPRRSGPFRVWVKFRKVTP